MNQHVHQRMAETSQRVWGVVETCLHSDLFRDIPGLRPHLDFFPSRRRGRLLLKPFLVRCGFELGGGGNWEDILPICAAAELLNIATYQSNAAFDSKYSLPDATGQFIASSVVRELAQEAMLNIPGIVGQSTLVELLRQVSHAVTCVYLAQCLDLQVLRSPKYDIATATTETFLQLYDLRCRLGSGHLIAACLALGYRLAGGPNAPYEQLFRFGLEYGTGLHVVNDIADYVTTNADTLDSHKGGQDCFTDLREGKITLPLWCMLTSLTGTERERLLALIGAEPAVSDMRWVFRTFLSCGAFAHCKSIVKGYYRRAKSILHNLARSEARDVLSSVASSLRTNKYFWAARVNCDGQDNQETVTESQPGRGL